MPRSGAQWKKAALRSAKFFTISLLLPFVDASPASAQDFLIKALPGYESRQNDSAWFAGMLPVSEKANTSEARELFFWYFKARNITDLDADKRIVFWFAGGPGCSSVKQVFSRNGPLVFNGTGQISLNHQWSWTELADVVFVDSPYGTGFSRVPNATNVRNEEDVASDFQRFLEAFGVIFPEAYQKELYLAGQGYAGMSVPYMARSILDRRRQAKLDVKQVNLRGIALANGFVWPAFHYGSVLRHLEAFGEVYLKLPVATRRLLKSIKDELMHHYYHETKPPIVLHHWAHFKDYLLEALRNATGPCFEWHDIMGVNDPDDCIATDEGQALSAWLNEPNTWSSLHVPASSAEWLECRTGELLADDSSSPSYMLFDDLLREIRIVLYNGDRDMYANYVGTEEFLRTLSWGSRLGWEDKTLLPWGGVTITNSSLMNNGTVMAANGTEGNPWALVNTDRGLVYLRVLGSGYDTFNAKPEVVYRILKDFVFQDDGIREVEGRKKDKTTKSSGPPLLVNSTDNPPSTLTVAADTTTKRMPGQKTGSSGTADEGRFPPLVPATTALQSISKAPPKVTASSTADSSFVSPQKISHATLGMVLAFAGVVCGVGFCIRSRPFLSRRASLQSVGNGVTNTGNLFSNVGAGSRAAEPRRRPARGRYMPVAEGDVE